MSATESNPPSSKDPILCPREEKDAYEARNLRELFEFTERFYPHEFIEHGTNDSAPIWRITPDTIFTMHRLCIQGIYPCAGNARPSHVEVSVKDAPHLVPTEPHLIHLRLAEICDLIEANTPGDKIQGLQFAPTLIHRITEIHPFAGGNGRVARALTDLFLYRQRVVRPGVHIGYAVDESRDRYIEVLRDADTGDIAPLADFLIRSVVYLRLRQQVLDVEQLVEQAPETIRSKVIVERPAAFRALTEVDKRLNSSVETFLERFYVSLEWQGRVIGQIRELTDELLRENKKS